MGKLIKDPITSFIPGNPGNPGSPYIPASPARVTFEQQTVCEPVYSPAPPVVIGGNESLVFGSIGSIYAPSLPPGYNGVSSGYGQVSCVTSMVQVFHPATAAIPAVPASPPTPAQISVSLNRGWNTHAPSFESFAVGSRAKFTVSPDSYGVIIGLSQVLPAVQPPELFSHALLVDGSGIYVMEHGNIVHRLGSNGFDLEISIQRNPDGRVVYMAGSDAYISESPLSTALDLKVYGMLYSAGDEITTAEYVSAVDVSSIGPTTLDGAATLSVLVDPFARLEGHGDLLVAVNGIAVTMRGAGSLYATLDNSAFSAVMAGHSTLAAYPESGGYGISSLPAIFGFGSDIESSSVGIGSLTLPPLSASGQGGQIVPFAPAEGNANLPFMSAWGFGSDTEVGHGDAELPMFMSQASEGEYGIGSAALPMTYASGSGGFIDEDELILVSSLFAVSGNTPRRDIVIVLNSTGQVASMFQADLEYVMELLSEIAQSDSMALVGVYSSELVSFINATSLQASGVDNSADLPAGSAVWVVNIDTGASSQYEDYGFNSFFVRNGVAYGVANDGVYRLDGDDDSGKPVETIANLGSLDLATASKKVLPSAYVAASSDGRLVLEVNADGSVYAYEARDGEVGTFRQHRFDLGRGLKANMLGLTLKNKDGGDFEIASFDILTTPTSRRI